MKAGKEDIIGLLAAVEWYLAQDHDALAKRYEDQVHHIVGWARGRTDVVATRESSGEAGQPTPRARIRLDGATSADRDRFLSALRTKPPRIDLLADDATGFYVAPETLRPAEEEIITEKLGQLLDDGSRWRQEGFRRATAPSTGEPRASARG
jgi:L-seryl-tRNA(Ser) seleniumtransferase